MAPRRNKWRKNSGKGVKGLKGIRVVKSSSEEEEFLGFKEGDTTDNKVWTDSHLNSITTDLWMKHGD